MDHMKSVLFGKQIKHTTNHYHDDNDGIGKERKNQQLKTNKIQEPKRNRSAITEKQRKRSKRNEYNRYNRVGVIQHHLLTLTDANIASLASSIPRQKFHRMRKRLSVSTTLS